MGIRFKSSKLQFYIVKVTYSISAHSITSRDNKEAVLHFFETIIYTDSCVFFMIKCEFNI